MSSRQGSSERLGHYEAYYGLTVVTLLNLLSYIDRFILSAVLPRIKTDLALRDFQLGLLANGFLVAYFITSPLLGRVGDRRSRSRLLAAGAGLWSAAAIAAGFARGFGQLLTARAAVGVGAAPHATIAPALLADYFPPARRGRVFSAFYGAVPIGAATGFLLGGVLERAFGWRAAFFAVGLSGLGLSALALTVSDPVRGMSDPGAELVVAHTWREIRHALSRNRVYIGTVVGYTAYTFAVGGLAIWMPTFFERVRHVPLYEGDFLVGSATFVAGLVGTLLGGYAGDLLSARYRHGLLWLCGVSALAATAPAWFALTAESPSTYTAAFFMAELLLFVSTGPVNVILVSAVPVGMRSVAMAVSIFAIHALGDAVSPPMIGALADVGGLARAVLVVPPAIAISGLIWIMTAVTANGTGESGDGSVGTGVPFAESLRSDVSTGVGIIHTMSTSSAGNPARLLGVVRLAESLRQGPQQRLELDRTYLRRTGGVRSLQNDVRAIG